MSLSAAASDLTLHFAAFQATLRSSPLLPMKRIALITDEPQAKTNADGTKSAIHLPAVASEAAAIERSLAQNAERHSRISVRELRVVLKGKRIWFFPGHGDAMLQGEPVLAFEKDGVFEAVSIQTLTEIVKWHVKHSQLQLVVLTGCCTYRLGTALHEHAGVPDVVCWSTVLHDEAGKIFGEAFASEVAKQISEDVAKLDPAAAFAAACASVHSETEAGQLDTGHSGMVQKFELHVDPLNRSLVHTGKHWKEGRGRLRSNLRFAAGKPVHLSATQLPGGQFAINVDGVSVRGTPAFYEWCTQNELTIDGTPVPSEHVGKKLFIYHAVQDDSAKERYRSLRDEHDKLWESTITRCTGDDSGSASATSHFKYNGKPIVVKAVNLGQRGRKRDRG